MSEQHEIEYALTVNIEDATNQIRSLERMLFRALSLARRMGLPEDISQGIDAIQRMITTVRMLRLSLLALQAASGPVGWATALMGLTIGMAEAGELTVDLPSKIAAQRPFLP